MSRGQMRLAGRPHGVMGRDTPLAVAVKASPDTEQARPARTVSSPRPPETHRSVAGIASMTVAPCLPASPPTVPQTLSLPEAAFAGGLAAVGVLEESPWVQVGGTGWML